MGPWQVLQILMNGPIISLSIIVNGPMTDLWQVLLILINGPIIFLSMLINGPMAGASDIPARPGLEARALARLFTAPAL
jgi:hypothetical protein